MKKILIALIAVATAAAVNAASYSWSGTINVYDWNNDQAATGSLEFFINSASVGIVAFDANGDATFGTYNLETGDAVSIVATLTGFSDGAGTVTYSEIFSSSYIDSYPTADDAVNSLALSASGIFDANGAGIDFSQTAAANGFSPASVPEPTSGLMLLLGMAGLALKRKRA